LRVRRPYDDEIGSGLGVRTAERDPGHEDLDSPEHAVFSTRSGRGSTARYNRRVTRALGRYELVRPLARGGMAEVFLARRRAAGVEKWLVVKRIRAERAADPRFLDLFVREARLSMSLAHQNIVPVFDFGRIDD